jgi:hypothetical protein
MSSSSQPFDSSAAHRFFSAHCFNEAWALIDKPNRTEEENRLMLAVSFASLWHWSRRDDCVPRNLSIGYWQVSRIFALLGDSANARRYGDACMEHSLSESPFFLAYAHEALARAAALDGDSNRCAQHLTEARQLASQIADAEERAALEKDLRSITLP